MYAKAVKIYKNFETFFSIIFNYQYLSTLLIYKTGFWYLLFIVRIIWENKENYFNCIYNYYKFTWRS